MKGEPIRFGDDLRIHIREALAERDITDAQLADRLGVSPSRVCHLLAIPSRGRLSLKMVDRIADAIGCRLIVRVQPHAEPGTVGERHDLF